MTTLKTQLTQLREQYQLKQQVQSLEDVYDRYRTIGDGLLDVADLEARDNFNRRKLSGPDSLSVVKNLQKYSDEMVALKRSMDPDAPDDVLRFFEALDRHNHASLTLLTPGVIAWLEEKGMLSAFNVTRKRMI